VRRLHGAYTCDVSELEKYQTLLDDINRRFFHTENAYLVRRELYLHFNAAVNKETAIAYRKIINGHKGFFLLVLEATFSYYTIGLNQLVNSNDKKSLEKFINKLAADGHKDYSKELADIREKHSRTLKSIADLRMGHFAHAGRIELDKIEPISEDANIKLLEDLKVLMNKINSEIFNNTIWHQEGDSRESIKDTHDMMDNLLHGENGRLSEIDVEYLSGVFQSGRKKWLEPSE
jgi:hypothetical protein